MNAKDRVAYKLNFDFDYLGNISKKEKDPVSSFKEGELFYHNSEFGVYFALSDGAKISDTVAAKIGRQMKKKMFVKSPLQMF